MIFSFINEFFGAKTLIKNSNKHIPGVAIKFRTVWI